MAYAVTEACINCKHQECVEVCPVDCFYEGENFLVINPFECIDCGVCEYECPVDAIAPQQDAGESWFELNAKYAAIWPNITTKGDLPADSAAWADVSDKRRLLSPNPARR